MDRQLQVFGKPEVPPFLAVVIEGCGDAIPSFGYEAARLYLLEAAFKIWLAGLQFFVQLAM